MILDIDDFGDVTRSLKIAYGCQPGKTLLTGVNTVIQETSLLLYSETDFTNSTDAVDYRTPMPCEVRQYQITGFKIPSGASRFSFADFSPDQVSALVTIPFEQEVNVSLSQKRLVKRSRIIYQSDDLASLLTVGKLESMAMDPWSIGGLAAAGLFITTKASRLNNMSLSSMTLMTPSSI
jgi:hypothetical protein